MAHPFYWPSQYLFYPIGNTPAVSLTRDIAPEEDVDLLLLGCGEARNVLYSISCEPPNTSRRLDFTCCDNDPAILARNVLLFSLVADGKSTAHAWSINFHIYLDKESHSTLLEQCKKLIEFSETHERWNKSPYGAFLRMSSDYTLSELRRHWRLYCTMPDLSYSRLESIRSALIEKSKLSLCIESLGSNRSAGPLMAFAGQTLSEHFRQYWRTGISSSSPGEQETANLLNPTFVYSLAGEGWNVHHASDPLTSFHLTALFGNSKKSVTISQMVEAGKAEFTDWCSSYHASVSTTSSNRPVIRFLTAEAIVACRSLRIMATTGRDKLNIAVDQWKTQLMELSRDEYVVRRAPVIFDVVDTSNLDDHIGPINVLTIAIPLLSFNPSSVLYTESLLPVEQDATKQFAEHLHADITSLALVTGLCPTSYLSGFRSRSNTHELVLLQDMERRTGEQPPQFHEVTTWKASESGDALLAEPLSEDTSCCVLFNSRQLATFLYDMYHRLLERADPLTLLALNQQNVKRMMQTSNIVHFVRETFVLFLQLVRDRRNISSQQWTEIMGYFINFVNADQSLPLEVHYYNDLCAQLYCHSVHTIEPFRWPLPKNGRFVHWSNLPPVVRIILTVPRENLAVLEHGSANENITPSLHVEVRAPQHRTRNIFSSIHAAWGRAIPTGTNARPWAIFEQDPEGRNGRSSLVVTFVMPTCLLAVGIYGHPEDFNIQLSFSSTAAALMHAKRHNLPLTIYSARLMDESKVIVLPEEPLPSKPSPMLSPYPHPGNSLQLGPASPVSVDFDEQCELVMSMTSRFSIHNKDAQHLLQSIKAIPQISQISSCRMRVKLGDMHQDIRFPFPVIGSQNKVRLARTSLFIEVIVPPAGPLKPEGMKLNLFPVTRRKGFLSSWNIHRINLSQLPVLDVKAAKLAKWFNPHVGSMMSTRERHIHKNDEDDALTLVKDSLQTILVQSAGSRKGSPQRLFTLRGVETEADEILLFISNLRYDLPCHTVVCDGYVLPLHPGIIGSNPALGILVTKGKPVRVYEGEMRIWKQLLRASIERCRFWRHTENCEYASQGVAPLNEETDEVLLCSCGHGKDTEDMSKDALWKPLSPYVTRIALSPLFAVSYLETVIRDPDAYKCYVCRGKGKPKLMTCKECKKVRYCSAGCQKKDWKAHKPKCAT